MSYNAQGQRASYTVTPQGKTQPTLSESFAYQGSQITQEVVISGTTTYTSTFLFRPDGAPFMLVVQQPSQGYLIPSHYWYVTDGQGNVVAPRDAHNTIMDTYQYDAWGNPVSVSGRFG